MELNASPLEWGLTSDLLLTNRTCCKRQCVTYKIGHKKHYGIRPALSQINCSRRSPGIAMLKGHSGSPMESSTGQGAEASHHQPGSNGGLFQQLWKPAQEQMTQAQST